MNRSRVGHYDQAIGGTVNTNDTPPTGRLDMTTHLQIVLLTLAAMIAAASAVAVVAGVLSRLAGASLPGAALTAGTAFAGTSALLLSVAVAIDLL
jgi:hypothetical protein